MLLLQRNAEIHRLRGFFAERGFTEVSFIGAGAHGVIFSVFDRRQRVACALKSLSLPLTAPPSEHPIYQQLEQRFLKECELLKEHRGQNHILQVHGGPYQKVEGDYVYSWYMMEVCAGSLSTLIGQQPLLRRARLALQLLYGLSSLHCRGVAHRDLKLGNLLLTPDLKLRIADFGAAWTVDEQARGEELPLGTLRYLAPEACDYLLSDTQPVPPDWLLCDQFAAGICVYEMLSVNGHPFPQVTASARLPGQLSAQLLAHRTHIIQRAPLPVRISERGGLALPHIDAVLGRMLSSDPTARYPRIRDCARDLFNAFAHHRLM